MNRIVCLLLLHFVCIAAPAVEVEPTHPRLLITAKQLPELHKRIGGDFAPDFKRLIDYLDTSVLPMKYTAHSWGWAYNLRTLAFAYVLTEDENYLHKINFIFEKIEAEIPKEEFSCALYTRCGAMAYDWSYKGMSKEQKAVAAKALLNLARHHQTLWKHNDYNNHYVFNWMSPLWVAIALHGDQHADKEMHTLLLKLEKHLKNRVIVAANDVASDDGGQAEGYSYANWGYFPPLAWLLELWRVGTGEDLFPTCSSLHYAALWNIYGMRPFDGTLERNDDCNEGYRFKEGNEGTFMQLCAQHYNDPYAQWITQQLKPKHPTRIMYDILWLDKRLKAKQPNDLPLARHFDGLGWVSTRSSWQQDAVFALFECGDLYAGHQHCDNNAFVIHRYNVLATDTGHYENGKHRANYFARTIAHNTVTIFDPNEQFGGNSWGGGKPGTGANDGGQTYIFHPESVDEKKSKEKFERGNLIAYQHDSLFTYAVGDATRSYAANKVKEFTRVFLHVQPDMFVIFDRVEASQVSYKKSWLLHAAVKPQLDNNTIVINNGDGRLFSQCLWPREQQMKIVGGAGQAYLVNGQDYPPKKGYEKKPPWRVELSPRAQAKRQYFLNFIHVPRIGAEQIVAELNQDDAVFTLTWRDQARRYQLVLSKDADVATELMIADGDKELVNRSLPCRVTAASSIELLEQ